MKTFPIRFESTDDVTAFVKAVNRFDCDIDLRRGSIIVDAKSFLGVMSISGDTDLELVIHSNDQEDILACVGPFLQIWKTA